MTLAELYFEKLIDKIGGANNSRLVLEHIFTTEFTSPIFMDRNRVSDATIMREELITDIYNCTDHPRIEIRASLPNYISVLEVLVALAVRVETFMSDISQGDRTSLWFWSMIGSIGIGFKDSEYNRSIVGIIVSRFLAHEYSPNGAGSIATLDECNRDMRTMELWEQINWYLSSLS